MSASSLSALACLALNVTAACHLLLLPSRRPSAPAHCRTPTAEQLDEANECASLDLGGEFCSGLSVAGAVRWPCSSQHRRHATAGVHVTAASMAAHCGASRGDADSRPW
ncbi:hypothetical protein CLOP_g924 [Closterium sp. NIES-67]|nr:hypothetical protein CLOP_g924 [Closterium sp. NIES-67]